MELYRVLGFLSLLVGASCLSTYTTQEMYGSREEGVQAGRRNTSCPCGWSNKEEGTRVIGGRRARLNEFPFIVPLIDLDKGYQFCDGTIVTHYHVVTAAHCTDSFRKSHPPIAVNAGDHDLRTVQDAHSTAVKVRRVYQHKGYDSGTFKNDISLLFLRKRIQFSQTVGPVCLPGGALNIEGQQVKVIGWGRTSHFRQSTSPVLKTADLRIVPYKKCAALWGLTQAKTQTCAWAGHAESCNGDSGGPLVWADPETNRYTLVGIVSFGMKNCLNKMPTVYTDPTAYLRWIKKKIADSAPQELCKKK